MLVVQAGTKVVLRGTVTASSAPVDLSGTVIEAVARGLPMVAPVQGTIVDAAAGRFEIAIDDEVTTTWPVGALGELRLTRIVGPDRFALGTVPVRVA